MLHHRFAVIVASVLLSGCGGLGGSTSEEGADDDQDVATVEQYLTASGRTLPLMDPNLSPAFDPQGEPLGPVLMGEKYRYAGLANSLRLEKDAANTKKVEAALNAVAQERVSSAVGTNRAPLDPLTGWNMADCLGETGEGTGADRYGAATGTFSPNGLQRQTSWTLQRATTCMRNQRNRGTCVAFAVNGAIESLYRRNEDKWINVSEQFLYAKYKRDWYPSTFGDGAYVGGMIAKLASERGFFVPYELSWNYNPSIYRVTNANTYTNSCEGYAEYCSDTSGQPRATGSGCNLATGAGCTFSFPGAGIGGKVANHASIWSSNISQMASSARTLTDGGKPLVMAIDVPPSFDRSGSTHGFVVYAGANENSRGGHAVEVVGVLSDADIAAYGATILSSDAGPSGSGGGYFIIKNSWGTSFGDGGFAYLPYNWVRDYANELHVIDRVGPVDAQPSSSCGRFNSNQGMFPNQPIYSCNGRFRLYLQSDSNLVLGMKDSQGNFSIALWATGNATISKYGTTLIMQGDGNLVFYDDRATAIWHTRTNGNAGAYFRIRDDGNMIVYSSANIRLWSSDTGGH